MKEGEKKKKKRREERVEEEKSKAFFPPSSATTLSELLYNLVVLNVVDIVGLEIDTDARQSAS
jgi:hypothetical protein